MAASVAASYKRTARGEGVGSGRPRFVDPGGSCNGQQTVIGLFHLLRSEDLGGNLKRAERPGGIRMFDSTTFTELAELSVQLNSRSDDLNRLIEELNSRLAASNLGLEFWLETHPISDTGLLHGQNNLNVRELKYLGYTKVQEKWQLAVREESIEYQWDQDNQIEIPVSTVHDFPLLKCSRDTRLKAADLFDGLLYGLKQTVIAKLDVIKRAEASAKPK
jgi:hypothetical protein